MNINKWTQDGKIFLWYYSGNPKNYMGWHLTCDKEGVISLCELINIMIKSSHNSKRTINLSEPTNSELKAPNCNSKAIAVKKLTIMYETNHPDNWQFIKENERAFLYVGNTQLVKLQSGLKNILQGKGDHSIGVKENKLWFWWRLN